MKDKKGNKLIILVIVLVLIIIGLVGYVLVSENIISIGSKETVEKQDEQKNESQEKEQEDAVEISINNENVVSMFDMVHGNAYTDDKVLIFSNGGIKVSKMTEEYKFNLASNLFQNDIVRYTSPSPQLYVSEEVVKNSYEKLFGVGTYKIPAGTVKFSCSPFNYNATSKAYISYVLDCGEGISSFKINEKMIKALRYNDRIEIISSVIYVDLESNSLYKDYNKTQKIADYNSNLDLDNYVVSNASTLEQYAYVFKLGEDGFYYYDEVKRIKQ